jgi:hypothetical protein
MQIFCGRAADRRDRVSGESRRKGICANWAKRLPSDLVRASAATADVGLAIMALSLTGIERNVREEVGLIAPFTLYVLPVVIVTVGLWQLAGLRLRW